MKKVRTKQLPLGVAVIAFWFILSTTPFIQYYFNMPQNAFLSSFFTFSILYTCCAVIIAIGLFTRNNSARKGGVLFSIVLFGISLFIIKSLSGPCFPFLIENIFHQIQDMLVHNNIKFDLTIRIIKTVIITLLIPTMIWPLIIFFYLTHPKIKSLYID